MCEVCIYQKGVCLKRLGNAVFQQETVLSCRSVSCGPTSIYWGCLRMAHTIWGHPACLVSVGPNPLGALGGLPDGFVVCQMKVISSVEARSWRVQS